MLNTSRVCICLFTYNRLEYAVKTLASAQANIKYDGPLTIHIADDGSPLGYREALLRVIDGIPCTYSDSGRRGYGANYNVAMQTTHQVADVVLALEDDWVLNNPLDITPLVEALNEYDNNACIRLGYIGFTQPLFGEVKYIANHHYLELNPDSPEPHVFAGHPRLETVKWELNVGEWPEGLQPGHTEFTVAHIPTARQRVLWPMDYNMAYGSLFSHIGTERSY